MEASWGWTPEIFDQLAELAYSDPDEKGWGSMWEIRGVIWGHHQHQQRGVTYHEDQETLTWQLLKYTNMFACPYHGGFSYKGTAGAA